MKYNNEVFNISTQNYPSIQEIETSDADKQLEDKLLSILLKKVSKELSINPRPKNGIVKVYFKHPFLQEPEDGYHLIQYLIAAEKFDSFAREYCFYLGNVEYSCDKDNSAYFEIIWDYKTYFEGLSMNALNINSENTDSNKIIESLIDFKQLPLKYQIAVLEFFGAKVDEYKQIVSQEAAEKICASEGHQFSKWKKFVDINYEDAWIDHELIHNYRSEKTMWERTCARCGYVERVEQEPQELVDQQRKINKQAKIKKLEKTLRKLKDDH